MSRKEENTGCEQLTILFGRVPNVLSHWDTESKRERYVAVASRAKKEEDDEERVGVGQPGFALVVRMSRIPVFSRNLTGSCFCYQATRYYVSLLYASKSTLDQANPSEMMQDRVQVGKLNWTILQMVDSSFVILLLVNNFWFNTPIDSISYFISKEAYIIASNKRMMKNPKKD